MQPGMLGESRPCLWAPLVVPSQVKPETQVGGEGKKERGKSRREGGGDDPLEDGAKLTLAP